MSQIPKCFKSIMFFKSCFKYLDKTPMQFLGAKSQLREGVIYKITPSAVKHCEHLEMLECAQSTKSCQQSTEIDLIKQGSKSRNTPLSNSLQINISTGSSPGWLMIISSMEKRTEFFIRAMSTRPLTGEEGKCQPTNLLASTLNQP